MLFWKAIVSTPRKFGWLIFLLSRFLSYIPFDGRNFEIIDTKDRVEKALPPGCRASKKPFEEIWINAYPTDTNSEPHSAHFIA